MAIVRTVAPRHNRTAGKHEVETSPDRPRPLRVDPRGIPPELREPRQWVCWGYEWRGGKEGEGRWTKVPLDPKTGSRASTTDPRTWGAFEQASAYYQEYRRDRHRRCDGLGFVFTEGDPFCGVDLDDCRNPGTGEVEPWAAEILHELGSYAEVSPSGTGVKVFLRGKVPAGGNRKGKVELYDAGRYFAVTGRTVAGGGDKVLKRQKALSRLHARLFAPPAGNTAPDASSADDTPATVPSPTGDIPLGRVLARLRGVAPGNSGNYAALCPAHPDRDPSLSVAADGDGKVLLHCFRGCRPEAVVEAIGLTMRDLFPPSSGTHEPGERRDRPPQPKGRAYAKAKEALAALDALVKRTQRGERAGKWNYHNADGDRVALVVRYDLPTPEGGRKKKTFRPVSQHRDGWHLCDPPGLWPLYRRNELTDAKRVFVAEGEKCADALADLGLAATTSAHGARSPGKTDWSPLAGKEVVLLPDDDEAGRTYARDVASILARLTTPPNVKVLDLAFDGRREHDDVIDWLNHMKGKK